MMSSEKKIAGVTSRAASASSFCRASSLRSGGAFSSFLWAASTITISASTVAPIAMAIPPSDMIVAGDAEEPHRDERDRAPRAAAR